MTINAETREWIMEELGNPQTKIGWAVIGLCDDSARLERIERQVRKLADEEMEAARYLKTIDPDRAYRQRYRTRKLRAILDTEKEAGDG